MTPKKPSAIERAAERYARKELPDKADYDDYAPGVRAHFLAGAKYAQRRRKDGKGEVWFVAYSGKLRLPWSARITVGGCRYAMADAGWDYNSYTVRKVRVTEIGGKP